MRQFVIGGVLAVGLLGCGGATGAFCSKSQECAQKSGATFSISECQNNVTANREKAASKNCASQFDDLATCLAGLSCDAINDANAQEANCGGKNNTYVKCMQ
jgi:hypothetical protein